MRHNGPEPRGNEMFLAKVWASFVPLWQTEFYYQIIHKKLWVMQYYSSAFLGLMADCMPGTFPGSVFKSSATAQQKQPLWWEQRSYEPAEREYCNLLCDLGQVICNPFGLQFHHMKKSHPDISFQRLWGKGSAFLKKEKENWDFGFNWDTCDKQRLEWQLCFSYDGELSLFLLPSFSSGEAFYPFAVPSKNRISTCACHLPSEKLCQTEWKPGWSGAEKADASVSGSPCDSER